MERYASIFRCGKRETDGISRTMVSRGTCGAERPGLCTSAAKACDDPTAGKFLDVFRTRHAELNASSPVALSPSFRVALCAASTGGARICGPVRAPACGGRERTAVADRTGRFLQHACRDAACGCEAA